MVSIILKSPIFTPERRCAQCGAMDMDSWPPATMMDASPVWICCMPIATARRPEPHSWLRPQEVVSCGMPAAMAAWRAGFWPWPADRIWPITTSSTSRPSTPARASASRMAIAPNSWAATLANAPLNEPTGVRAALATTMEFDADMMCLHDWKSPPGR